MRNGIQAFTHPDKDGLFPNIVFNWIARPVNCTSLLEFALLSTSRITGPNIITPEEVAVLMNRNLLWNLINFVELCNWLWNLINFAELCNCAILRCVLLWDTVHCYREQYGFGSTFATWGVSKIDMVVFPGAFPTGSDWSYYYDICYNVEQC